MVQQIREAEHSYVGDFFALDKRSSIHMLMKMSFYFSWLLLVWYIAHGINVTL